MRLLVRVAEAWIRQNQPDPDALYSTVEHLPDCAWGVYQLIDHAGRVLYVGMTGRPKARVLQHLREFGERIDWVDFQRFSSRVDAYDAETALIRALVPPMNIAKAPR